MITKIFIIFLILVILSILYKCCFKNVCIFRKEHFQDKLNENEFIINIFPNLNKSKPNKYVVYKDDKSIIESDNDCIWHCNEGKKLSNIIKNNFNSEYDKIIIQPINGFTYDIYHKGNKEEKYIFKKESYNKYKIYKNQKKMYDIYQNKIDDRETITIRNDEFDNLARITFDNTINDTFSGFMNKGQKYIYKVSNKSFEPEKILGLSIFQLINEINRDKYN